MRSILAGLAILALAVCSTATQEAFAETTSTPTSTVVTSTTDQVAPTLSSTLTGFPGLGSIGTVGGVACWSEAEVLSVLGGEITLTVTEVEACGVTTQSDSGEIATAFLWHYVSSDDITSYLPVPYEESDGKFPRFSPDGDIWSCSAIFGRHILTVAAAGDDGSSCALLDRLAAALSG